MDKRDKCECSCEIDKKATYYCQECRQYICSICFDHNKTFRAFTNHMLYPTEDVRSMTPLEFFSLHRHQCNSLHNEPVKFFCKYCKIVRCTLGAITDHKAANGSNKAYNSSKEFNGFKQTGNKIEENANYNTTTVQDGLTKMHLNVNKLDENNDTILRDIDNHVKEMLQIIKDKGQELKKKVERKREKKKCEIDAQIHDLRTSISDVKTKFNVSSQLLRSDEATSSQSSEAIITGLKDRIKELPSKINKGATENNQEIHFFQNKHQITALKRHGIGIVSEKIADCLKVNCSRNICATQYQIITVKLVKIEKCEIHASQLEATWTVECTGETNMTPVQEDDDGNYIVKGVCTSIGVYRLDISIDCEPVKHSPIMINVEKEGLVNTIKVGKKVTDVEWCNKENCLLVAYWKNDIYKYKQNGEYIGKITLPAGVRVNRMHKMKNGQLAFSDDGNYKSIKICTMDGQVKKTVGKGCLEAPSGVKVNEAFTKVYATSFFNKGAFKFSMYKNVTFVSEVINKTNVYHNGYNDVTFTKEGKLLLLNHIHNRLELFDKEQFSKVLVWPGDDSGKIMKPGGVVVDDDGNIIISSINKLQLFNSDGTFIKRIDTQEDGINFPWGLAIISYHPRRVALTNHGDRSVKIFNY
ncbi:uncharacterized protein LOC117105319 [Anneissia japonica]|uniref:uncharacterized protein LOC117105319 n=1 Tax=Anneissia japonica TaxID=1529436 RepID=UPI00142598FD|nr:uncharacterized protein LOC117105319 [Anneissia japonica]